MGQNWDDLPLVLTSDEVAEILRVSPQSVRAMCRDGRLQGTKIGKQWRIERRVLQAYLSGEPETQDEKK